MATRDLRSFPDLAAADILGDFEVLVEPADGPGRNIKLRELAIWMHDQGLGTVDVEDLPAATQAQLGEPGSYLLLNAGGRNFKLSGEDMQALLDAGTRGPRGPAGANGYSPVLALKHASATALDPNGARIVLEVVDWIESTGGLGSAFKGTYDAAVTYQRGEIVEDSVSNDFFISGGDANTGNAVTDTDHWRNITGGTGGGGGLSSSQVNSLANARIRVLVSDWALAANTDELPDAKIPPEIARDDEIEDAALVANGSTRWGKDKLPADTSYRTDAQVDARADARILASDRILPAATSADDGKIAKVDSSGDWVLGDDNEGSGGGGGLTQSQVDQRIQAPARAGNTTRWAKNKLPTDTSYRTDAQIAAFTAAWARATGASGTIPDARLPATAKRTDAQVDARADARVTAGTIAAARSQATFDSEVDGRVADEALEGNVERWPISKLPTNVSTRTDAQVRALALALVSTWARATSPSGTVPAARLPSTATRSDSQINTLASARVAPWARAQSRTGRAPKDALPSDTVYDGDSALLPAVTTANNDKILKVVSGAWALADDEQGSGGGGGGAADLTVTLINSGSNRVGPSSSPLPETGLLFVFVGDASSSNQQAAWRVFNIADIRALDAGVQRTFALTESQRIQWNPARLGASSPRPLLYLGRDSNFNLLFSSTQSVNEYGIYAVSGFGGGGGSAGLDRDAVDARVQALVENFAEVGNNAVVPDAKLPAAAKRTDAQIQTLADGRVADWAQQVGRSGRAPKAALPADTSYRTDAQVRSLATALIANWARATGASGTVPTARLPSTATRTDAQVDSRADARIAPWARQNSPSGTIPAARLPSTATRTQSQLNTIINGRITAGTIAAARSSSDFNTAADGRIATFARANSPSGTVPVDRLPSARILPAVSAANNGQILKVANGAFALGTDETGSGGGGGLTQAQVDARIRALIPQRVDRVVDLATAATVSAASRAWGTWTDLVSVTIAAAEAGDLLIFGHCHGIMAAPTGSQRGFSEFRIRRTRGTEVIDTHGQYGPRAMASTFPEHTVSLETWGQVVGSDTAQSGDVYTLQARHWTANSAGALDVTYAAGHDTNIHIHRAGPAAAGG